MHNQWMKMSDELNNIHFKTGYLLFLKEILCKSMTYKAF